MTYWLRDVHSDEQRLERLAPNRTDSLDSLIGAGSTAIFGLLSHIGRLSCGTLSKQIVPGHKHNIEEDDYEDASYCLREEV